MENDVIRMREPGATGKFQQVCAESSFTGPAPNPAIGHFHLPMKTYPTPILRPLAPMFIGAAATYYLIGNVATGLMQAPEYANDPRNPNAGKSH